VEIVGFWTRDYLESKLSRLRRAGVTRWLLCVDERRRCSDGDLPPDPRIVRYRSRIDPAAVLAVIGS
jgi:predicted nuclease of restriction endonuclease-like RecB superfamily